MTPNRSSPSLTGHLSDEDLLRPGDVARIFKVDPKTVTRWHRCGKIPALFTPGGHRRFRESDVREFLRTGRGRDAETAAA